LKQRTLLLLQRLSALALEAESLLEIIACSDSSSELLHNSLQPLGICHPQLAQPICLLLSLARSSEGILTLAPHRLQEGVQARRAHMRHIIAAARQPQHLLLRSSELAPQFNSRTVRHSDSRALIFKLRDEGVDSGAQLVCGLRLRVLLGPGLGQMRGNHFTVAIAAR
jgi:hypothetical protein